MLSLYIEVYTFLFTIVIIYSLELRFLRFHTKAHLHTI